MAAVVEEDGRRGAGRELRRSAHSPRAVSRSLRTRHVPASARGGSRQPSAGVPATPAGRPRMRFAPRPRPHRSSHAAEHVGVTAGRDLKAEDGASGAGVLDRHLEEALGLGQPVGEGQDHHRLVEGLRVGPLLGQKPAVGERALGEVGHALGWVAAETALHGSDRQHESLARAGALQPALVPCNALACTLGEWPTCVDPTCVASSRSAVSRSRSASSSITGAARRRPPGSVRRGEGQCQLFGGDARPGASRRRRAPRAGGRRHRAARREAPPTRARATRPAAAPGSVARRTRAPDRRSRRPPRHARARAWPRRESRHDGRVARGLRGEEVGATASGPAPSRSRSSAAACGSPRAWRRNLPYTVARTMGWTNSSGRPLARIPAAPRPSAAPPAASGSSPASSAAWRSSALAPAPRRRRRLGCRSSQPSQPCQQRSRDGLRCGPDAMGVFRRRRDALGLDTPDQLADRNGLPPEAMWQARANRSRSVAEESPDQLRGGRLAQRLGAAACPRGRGSPSPGRPDPWPSRGRAA